MMASARGKSRRRRPSVIGNNSMDKTEEAIRVRRLERWYTGLEGMVLEKSAPIGARLLSARPIFPRQPHEPSEGRAIAEGDVWGRTWETAWFHLTGRVPADWSGRTVVAQIDLGGEGLLLLPGGECLQGISNHSIFSREFKRDIVHLFRPCRGNEEVDLYAEASASELFGVRAPLDPPEGDPDRHGRYEARIERLRLAVFDVAVWSLMCDLRVLLGLVRRLPEKGVRRARLIHAAGKAADHFAGIRERAAEAGAILGAELFKPAEASSPCALAIGHAHIDTAWLWPVDEGRRKCARTFASQMRLLDGYPDYYFGASQAQHYAFVREDHPELYTRIQAAVKAGRWEIQGGMWVEADCNLIDGESMIRQILHGKNFFRDEFGVDVDNLWLPDVFGYSAALPQILRKCGIDTFLTQKMSWSQFNAFPHTTFRWRGIDGSEVIAHFPPENNYNSLLDPDSLIPGMENFREKGFLDTFLSLFGVGDGGGGPKEEQIEYGRRMRDLEGCPRTRFGTAREFFGRTRGQQEQLPLWSGELYLELHRGTLTSQAAVKRGNRWCEQALRAVEILCAAGQLAEYPAEDLDRLWKSVLLNQFHDILPGSSIGLTYARARDDHAAVLAGCDELMGRIADRRFQSEQNAMTVFQPHAAVFDGAIELPREWAGFDITAGNRTIVSQDEDAGPVALVQCNPFEFCTLRKGAPRREAALKLTGPVLENSRIRYEFDAGGRLVRAWDKEAFREVIPADEPGNAFTLYEDRPNDWDAWDIDLFYEDAVVARPRADRMELLEAGPVRQRLRFEFSMDGLRMRQTVILAEGSRRLDFVTEASWTARHRMLRVAFPVTVRAAEASYEIQHGIIRRPTHRNTSWDIARFEAVAHRFVDLSDSNYGVALLNDSKYGHKVLDHVIDLNLLRSPTNPDPDADRGEHRFTHSLYPHIGALEDSDVVAQAASLNCPPLRFPRRAAGGMVFPLRLESDGIALAAFKKAEKSDDRIIRLVETRGRVSSGRLTIVPRTGILVNIDLMEWNESGAPHPCDESLDLTLQPFEIRTYRWRE
jgi:alpha-mannosidase